MSNLAPILLFTYKRLETLKKTVSALQANYLASDSELIIFSDGPKNESEISAVNEVREYLKTIHGFRNVKIFESSQNKGLANSIIDGVTEVLQRHDSVIVLEDDLITTPNFLLFMNQALQRYKNDQRVFSVSGYAFNLTTHRDEMHDAYFLNRGWSWGWATWKDRWVDVDWDVSDYERFKSNRKMKKAFAKGGSDLNIMLQRQMEGKLDSWAIRWFYHQYRVDGLTLYPVYSKVKNAGFDALATHTNGSDRRYRPVMDSTSASEFTFPKLVKINSYCQKKFRFKMGIFSRIRSKVETHLLRLING